MAPTGTVVAQAASAVPGRGCPAELLVHRIDMQLAQRRDPVSAPTEDQRRPDLYAELVDLVPAVR